MKRKRFESVVILVGSLWLISFPAFSTEAPRSKEATRIAALVDKAAALVESKGKAAFPEFRKKDSEWYKKDTYIFISDMKGINLFHPVSPELQGKDLIDLKDVNGKAFIREFIDITEKKGQGWVEYMWPKPGEKKPSKKSSYLKKAKMPTGETVVVGAGVYLK